METSVLRIRDVYPGSRIPDFGSRTPDSKTATEEKVEKNVLSYFFVYRNHKYHNIEHYFIFELVKKKISANLQRINRTFYPKNCHLALKNIGLGSGIRVKKTPDPESGSAHTENTDGCCLNDTKIIQVKNVDLNVFFLNQK
jgi:hypothetical protein